MSSCANYNTEAALHYVKGRGFQPSFSVKELIKLIESDGWYWVRTKGSHRQFKHPVKLGTVTIPGNLSKDIAIGTLQSVLRQAQIEEIE